MLPYCAPRFVPGIALIAAQISSTIFDRKIAVRMWLDLVGRSGESIERILRRDTPFLDQERDELTQASVGCR